MSENEPQAGEQVTDPTPETREGADKFSIEQVQSEDRSLSEV